MQIIANGGQRKCLGKPKNKTEKELENAVINYELESGYQGLKALYEKGWITKDDFKIAKIRILKNKRW